MKRSVSLVLLFILLVSSLRSPAQTDTARSGNPVFEGWYADPEGMVFGKQYWIYPTYSDAYEKQVFFDAFSSNDLLHWTRHARILDTSVVKWARKALWAPAVIKKGEDYFFFFSANDVHPGETGGIGVATGKSPAGPFRDHIGKPLIGEVVNGAQPIDQFVFQDKDGAYYIIYGGWGHCNMARLKPDFKGFIPWGDGSTFREITPEGYVEGPVMFLRDNKYYFMWSEGGWTGPGYRVAYAMADSPFGPFRRIGAVLQQDPSVATGAGHHSVIRVPGTDKWYIVYHRRPKGETHPNHRVTCMEEMRFNEDGSIQPVKITFEGVPAQKIGAAALQVTNGTTAGSR